MGYDKKQYNPSGNDLIATDAAGIESDAQVWAAVCFDVIDSVLFCQVTYFGCHFNDLATIFKFMCTYSAEFSIFVYRRLL